MHTLHMRLRPLLIGTAVYFDTKCVRANLHITMFGVAYAACTLLLPLLPPIPLHAAACVPHVRWSRWCACFDAPVSLRLVLPLAFPAQQVECFTQWVQHYSRCTLIERAAPLFSQRCLRIKAYDNGCWHPAALPACRMFAVHVYLSLSVAINIFHCCHCWWPAMGTFLVRL